MDSAYCSVTLVLFKKEKPSGNVVIRQKVRVYAPLGWS